MSGLLWSSLRFQVNPHHIPTPWDVRHYSPCTSFSFEGSVLASSGKLSSVTRANRSSSVCVDFLNFAGEYASSGIQRIGDGSVLQFRCTVFVSNSLHSVVSSGIWVKRPSKVSVPFFNFTGEYAFSGTLRFGIVAAAVLFDTSIVPLESGFKIVYCDQLKHIFN